MPLVLVERYEDPAAFAAAVSDFLHQHEAENAIFLASLAASGRPGFMACATRAGATVGAAIFQDTNLIVSHGPDDAVDGITARLIGDGVTVPGVIGPSRAAERLAAAYAQARGCRAMLAFTSRVYLLTKVRLPTPPLGGRLRSLTTSDLDLVTGWALQFDAEALAAYERRTPAQTRAKVTKRIDDRSLFGWEIEGRLVAMAGLARPTANTISVNAVYTPPAERRRGFATALVTGLSTEALRRGKSGCVLHADIANPTSNAIYERIGYEPIDESSSYRFVPA